MIRHMQSPGKVRTVYSRIFRHVQGYDAYSATFTGVHLGGERRPPLPFFKSKKVS